jgi:hypothetical protein
VCISKDMERKSPCCFAFFFGVEQHIF